MSAKKNDVMIVSTPNSSVRVQLFMLFVVPYNLGSPFFCVLVGLVLCCLHCATYTGIQHYIMLSEFLFCYLYACIDVGLCHFRLGIRAFSVV